MGLVYRRGTSFIDVKPTQEREGLRGRLQEGGGEPLGAGETVLRSTGLGKEYRRCGPSVLRGPAPRTALAA